MNASGRSGGSVPIRSAICDRAELARIWAVSDGGGVGSEAGACRVDISAVQLVLDGVRMSSRHATSGKSFGSELGPEASGTAPLWRGLADEGNRLYATSPL